MFKNITDWSDWNQAPPYYWPPNPFYFPAGSERGSILVMLFILFWPLGVNELIAAPHRKRLRDATRKLANSVLMTSAKYIGGHPQLPTSCRVVLGLTEDHFNIYTIDNTFAKSKLKK